MKQQEAQKGMISSKQCEWIFDPFLYGVIVSDRQGKIVQINPAALKLFAVTAKAFCQGTPYQQFLQQYEMDDAQQHALSLEPWLMLLLTTEEGAASSPPETIKFLQLPSGQKRYVAICSSPIYDAHKHVAETIHVFRDITHRYQKVLHLQRVHKAVLKLSEIIGRISEQMELTFPQDTFLLSPAVIAIEQQLVEVVRLVLDCRHVAIWALGPPAGQLYYVAGSGFTPEEEQQRQELSGHYFPHEFLDKRFLDRLRNNEAVILSADDKFYPPGLGTDLMSIKQWLLVPLLLEEQTAGALLIAKADGEGDYTAEEMEFIKAVASNTMLVLDCFRYLCKQAQAGSRALAQQEIQRLTNNFLNLASHELNTSLTAIKGNVQVAQRRFAVLKRQLAPQSASVDEKMERVEDSLEATVQSVRLQERMLEDLLDDARIQANKLELHLHRHDLRALLREAVARKQGEVPQRPIVLESRPSENRVPMLVDAQRISRVITTYLEQTLSFSPTDQPVTVRLQVEDAIARVSVHDAGPAIPVEEQKCIWERFHPATRMAGGQEPDVGFGLDLYLSRAFIERHHGSVGVQSAAGQGTTFWFTLPIAAPPARSV